MHAHNEKDEWGNTFPSIVSAERLAVMREVLDVTPIIVEHWFFYGSCAPDRLIFDDYERLHEYLTSRAKPGDAIHVWRFDTLCRDDNELTHGKFPDKYGLTPSGGAY